MRRSNKHSTTNFCSDLEKEFQWEAARTVIAQFGLDLVRLYLPCMKCFAIDKMDWTVWIVGPWRTCLKLLTSPMVHGKMFANWAWQCRNSMTRKSGDHYSGSWNLEWKSMIGLDWHFHDDVKSEWKHYLYRSDGVRLGSRSKLPIAVCSPAIQSTIIGKC